MVSPCLVFSLSFGKNQARANHKVILTLKRLALAWFLVSPLVKTKQGLTILNSIY